MTEACALITGLVPDARRPQSIQVRLEGRPFLTVPSDIIEQERLHEGSVLTEEMHSRLCRAADTEAALRALYRAVARRPFASADVCRRLVRRGHPPHAAEAAVARAQTLGLLDDGEFVQEFLRIRLDRGHAPARLRRDLTALGVDRSIVDQALAAMAPGSEALLERARELAAERLHRFRDLPAETQVRRLVAFLARRGYRGGEYHRMVRSMIHQAVEV